MKPWIDYEFDLEVLGRILQINEGIHDGELSQLTKQMSTAASRFTCRMGIRASARLFMITLLLLSL